MAWVSPFPSAGRLIAADDDGPGAEPVAVLSFTASQQRFGGPVRALGQSILVDNTAFTVVGVKPPAFFGVDPSAFPDIYFYFPTSAHLLIAGSDTDSMFTDNNYSWK